ncbi:hypothetical protein [Peribacillus loiseleuriae]|uniref:hypothetical protein n=1 Tax=Peribacillus loiseleuriae TaxID=1679170 RepID=UPI003D01F104
MKKIEENRGPLLPVFLFYASNGIENSQAADINGKWLIYLHTPHEKRLIQLNFDESVFHL